MVRLKETINPNILEQYGFEKRLERKYDYKKHTSYYTTRYDYSFYKIYDNCFQSVTVYIEPFISTYGTTIHKAREVVANQHAFNCDKAVDLIVKLVIAGIFEYIESEETK